MPITSIVTFVKPPEVQFFHEISEENLALGKSIADWSRTQPGFISVSSAMVDSNTRTLTYVFDTVENYNAWLVNRRKQASFLTINEYYVINKIVGTVKETIS